MLLSIVRLLSRTAGAYLAAVVFLALAGNAGAFLVNVDGGSGTVTITLDAGGEAVTIAPDTIQDELEVNATPVGGILLSAINVIVVEGGDGNDIINVLDLLDVLVGTNGIAITLQGGDGSDSIVGGPGAETIVDDYGVLAPGTDSTIDGGAGSDTVRIVGGASGSNSGIVTLTLVDGAGAATLDNSDADPQWTIAGAEILEIENDFDTLPTPTTAGNQIVVIDGTAGGNSIGVSLGTDTGAAGALLPALALRNIAVDASVTLQSPTANNDYAVSDDGGIDEASCLPGLAAATVGSPNDEFADVVCEDGDSFSYDGVSGTDVLTLLGRSTTGEHGGIDEVADGSDTFTISNVQVASSNVTLGALATLLFSNVDTLELFSGNEVSAATGDEVEVLDPPFLVPALDLDGEGPADLPGDQLDVHHNVQVGIGVNFETAVPVGVTEVEID